MEDLACHLSSLSVSKHVPYYNHSFFDLYLFHTDSHTGVASRDMIPRDTYVGDIEGERKYIWDVELSDEIVWVEDDLVIDCTARPRCIISMIREGFYTGHHHNCKMVAFMGAPNTADEGYLHIGIQTIRDVLPGEELVYNRDMY